MKKHLLSLTIIVFLSLFFVSCEREISFENGGVPGVVTGGGTAGGTAQYDFDGGTAACTGAVLSGTFTAGTAVTAANTVTLDITVDSIGSWIVATSTVNGVSFNGSGNFTTTGAQTITLNATGTPTVAGTFNFTPGAEGCAFSVTVAPDTTTPPPTSDCKACIYTPFCIGSWLKYKIDFSGTISTLTNSYSSESDTVVNGVTYRKITGSSNNGTTTTPNISYFNCTNGVSTAFAYNVTGLGGTSVSFIKSTPIKANEPVGATWSEIIQNQIGQDITNSYTIIEKGISRTVLSKEYNDVIHIELRQSIDIMGTPTEAGVSQYYYARGVGLIETSNEAFGVTSSQLLEDYFIP